MVPIPVASNFAVMRRLVIFLVVTILAGMGCGRWYQPTNLQWNRLAVEGVAPSNNLLHPVIAPYHDSLFASMQKVIARVAAPLFKSDGENTLGNMVADALLFGARLQYPMVDLAIINRGGYRLNELPAGPLTVEKAYELLPFDNELLCLTLTGNELNTLLQQNIFSSGSWPVAGVTISSNGIEVNGLAVENNATYYLALSDYLADGGDNTNLLSGLPRQRTGYLVRDALLDYARHLTANGQSITPPATNRIQTK